MNESQRRREELLSEARRNNSTMFRNFSGTIPAVHPRYRAVYRNLYGYEQEEAPAGTTLGTRIFISLVLFAVFAAADYNGEKIWNYTPSQIASEIQKQPDVSGYLK